jgi:hypothetical protein
LSTRSLLSGACFLLGMLDNLTLYVYLTS